MKRTSHIDTFFHRIILMAMLVILSVNSFSLKAQSVNMPVTGFRDTTISHVFVYDDGGPTGAHSSSCNSKYTFHTVGALSKYFVRVNSQLTHPAGNATLRIYDGDTSDNYMMLEFPAYGSYYETRSNSNTVTITFVSDDDYPTAGFEVELCEYNNYIPYGMNVDFVDSTTIIVDWTETDTSLVWIFDYAFVEGSMSTSCFFDDSSNFNTLILNVPHVGFYDVPAGYSIICRVYSYDTSQCRNMSIYKFDPPSTPAECPCLKALNVTMTTLQDSVRLRWDADDSARYWNLTFIGTDTTLDGSVTEITLPFEPSCDVYFVSIVGNCTPMSCNETYYYLPVGGCQSSVWSINRESTTGSTVTLSWLPTTDSTDKYLLYYRLAGQPNSENILVDTLDYSVTEYTVTNLLPHTRYIFTIRVLCGGMTLACGETEVTISTTLDNCIDFIDFFDYENVHRTWGTYSNPSQYSFGPNTRHVVILDTSATDPATGGMLRCIPSGEDVSLRLGDNDVGALAETISYDYEVDSTDKDMIVLRFAVVMQNPNHTIENQPHFSMEIMDSSGVLLDTNCCFADFSAAGNLGWYTVPNSNVIWKDWTTVGIDIARYHGQRIKIRFTTKDCADGGHYGYAYFTVHCDSKRIALVNLCDNNDSVRLRAPEGFNYCWYKVGDSVVISTDNEIVVPADTTEYICNASFIGKPGCSFTVRSWAVLPQALADLHYTIDTCRGKLTLFSDCRVEIDSMFLPFVRQTIDSVRWVIDGDTLYGDTVTYYFSEQKVYHLMLSCKLSNSYCINYLYDSIDVGFVFRAALLGDSSLCQGDTLTLQLDVTSSGDVTYQWPGGFSDSIAYYLLTVDTVFTVVVNSIGCSDTLVHPVAVHQHYEDTIYSEICANQYYDSAGFHENISGIYTQYLQSIYGCDSLLTLDLTVWPVYSDTLYVATCDEPYNENGFNVDSTGLYSIEYLTTHGCDSIWHLEFVRHDVFRDTIHEEIYYGDTYTGYGFTEDETGLYDIIYKDTNQCDSIWSLDLLVINLRFPSAITPNGDGYNDVLEVVNLLESTMFDYTSLWVYDRSGRLVYHHDNITSYFDFWDPAKTHSPHGTYFYRFIARSISHEIQYKGAVEVIYK